ncbi:MAG: DNA alkylation repair protein [Acidobacteria bacterium]|nr:DNA alkylation repair protein [Acidobacteriota bacterium]
MTTRSLTTAVRDALEAAADPAKAEPMAAYMKYRGVFLGVQKPLRVPIIRMMKREFRPADRAQWRAGVEALWKGGYREQRYLAIEYAGLWPEFRTAAEAPLYERLAREGAWWDLVDLVMGVLVSPAMLAEREAMRKHTDRWIEDSDFWLRRLALLSQIKHKHETDEAMLFDYCLRQAGEEEFFIRKAIGWALRDYSWTNPRAVRRLLQENEGRFSALTVREASKRLTA